MTLLDVAVQQVDHIILEAFAERIACRDWWDTASAKISRQISSRFSRRLQMLNSVELLTGL